MYLSLESPKDQLSSPPPSAGPTSQWTRIPSRNILVCVPVPATSPRDREHHVLYVEKNGDGDGDGQGKDKDKDKDTDTDTDTATATATESGKAFPVLFRHAVLNNPPDLLCQDLVAPAVGANCWESRHDRGRDGAPNFHVVVSTASGTGRAEEVWRQLVKPALDYLHVEHGRHYVLHATTSEHSIAELTRDVLLPQANRGVRQSVMLLSGDGGMLDVINTLLSGQRGPQYQKANIALLPLGTGNALAHSAGLTQDNSLGLKTWLRGHAKELPLFCATFSPGSRVLVDEARREQALHTANGAAVAHGAVVASWGLHAGLVADSDTTEFRKFGVERFKMAAEEALAPRDGSPPHIYRAHVSIQRPGQDGWHTLRDGEHVYVLATLCSQLEKGFTISPASRQLDGKLRLIHFGPMSGEEAMAIMNSAYQGGKHVEDPRVGYEEIEALRIDFREDEGRWRRVCIDGEIIRVEKDGWMEVRAGQKGVVDLIV